MDRERIINNNDFQNDRNQYNERAQSTKNVEINNEKNIEPDRDALLIRLSECEFTTLDLQLYLNTHPCDTEAIERYNQLAAESKMLRDEYEKYFGSILSYISMSDKNYFSWISDPWPWDKDFINNKSQRSSRR